MPRQYTTVPASRLRRLENHVRTDLGGADELRPLGLSYLARPLYPLICTLALEILDGNRRHAGVLLVDADAELPICVIDEPWDESVKLEIQAESAVHTRGLSDYERYAVASRWLALNPDATAKDYAGRTRTDEGVVSKLLSLDKCIAPVKEAARAGRIGYTKWHPISQEPPEAQPALMEAALDGATIAELGRRRRARRNGNGRPATGKAGSFPIVTGGGLTATFKAKGITLEMALAALDEIRQEIKAAIAQSHTPKSLGELMKARAGKMTPSKAKAGG